MAIEKFPTDQEWDAWLGNGLNVYLEGKHGVGKTEMPLAACRRLGLKFKYYSVPTLDPWVNFVGIPREGVGKDGERFIDFLLPKEMSSDLEVLILDEYPRAKAAIRNAVMELIQFKSINGRKFPKLRSIIAMANPHDDDGTYDGERVDPAQLDRFHVHVQVPYTMNVEWCKNKYGASAEPIMQWWNGLASNVRDAVSPRRVAQAYDACKAGIDPEAMLPYQANLAAFETICLGGDSSALVKIIERMVGMGMPARSDTAAGGMLDEREMRVLAIVQPDELKSALGQVKTRAKRAVVFAHMPRAVLERLSNMRKTSDNAWFAKWFLSSESHVPSSILSACVDGKTATNMFSWGMQIAKDSGDEALQSRCVKGLRAAKSALDELMDNDPKEMDAVDVDDDDRWDIGVGRP